MTREQILADFTVDKHGVIRTLGQFEGEMIYVPYFWDAYINGVADRDDGKVLGFDVTKEDREMFPELGRKRTVRIYQRDDGFICEC